MCSYNIDINIHLSFPRYDYTNHSTRKTTNKIPVFFRGLVDYPHHQVILSHCVNEDSFIRDTVSSMCFFEDAPKTTD